MENVASTWRRGPAVNICYAQTSSGTAYMPLLNIAKLSMLYNIIYRNVVWLVVLAAEIRVPQGSWVLGNVDYMGFFRTNYDEPTWSLLTEQLIQDNQVVRLWQ